MFGLWLFAQLYFINPSTVLGDAGQRGINESDLVGNDFIVPDLVTERKHLFTTICCIFTYIPAGASKNSYFMIYAINYAELFTLGLRVFYG